MAEAAAPKQKSGARALSRQNAFLNLLFAVLNFVLSGPPSWQRILQQSVGQQKPDWRINLLWGAPLGVILGIMLACIYYFGFENTTPNLFNDQWTGIIAYTLLLAFLFFLSSLLCGRVTCNGDDGLRIVLIAFLTQTLTALVLLIVFSLVFSFWDWDCV